MARGLSADEKAELVEVFGEAGGYSVGRERPANPMDWVFNEWKHGRQVTGSGYVPPVVSPTFFWADGTPQPGHPTSRAEWAALVAEHGLNPAYFVANIGEGDDGSEEEDD